MIHIHLRRLAASIILLSAFVSGLALAQWSHEPTENNVVTDATNDQGFSQVVDDGSGGTIVAYLDYSVSNLQVILHRFDTDGNALWGSGVVVYTGQGSLTGFFDIVADGTGGVFLTFQDSHDGLYYHLYAQHVSAAGVPEWGANGVNVCPGVTSGQTTASLCPDGTGGLLLAFLDDRNVKYDVFGQRLDASGSLLWSNQALGLCTAAGDKYYPAIVPDGTGGFYVTWTDTRNYATTGQDIYTNHYAVDGTPLWTFDGYATCSEASDQFNHRAVSDGQGGVVVVWSDKRDFATNSYDIYAQHYVASGTSVFPYNGLAVCTQLGVQHYVDLACDTLGRTLIAWSDARSDSYTGDQIYAQLLSPGGTPLWTADGLMVAPANGAQSSPKVAVTSDNNLAIVWTDYRSGTSTDIYGQLLSPAGNRLASYYGEPLMTAFYVQTGPEIEADGRGGFVVVADDYRKYDDVDIYMQRVDRTGFLGDPAATITRLIDHPQDQGGTMLLEWAHSWLDDYQESGVYGYSVWRRYPGASAAPALAQKAVPVSESLTPEKLAALQKAGWYWIDEVNPMQLDEYGYVVPTFADSTEAGTPVTEYMVLTETGGGLIESNVVGGWSVDNLVPGAPLALGAVVAGADVNLDWTGSGENDEDLLHYNIYRATQPGVVAGAGTFLASSADSLHTDPAVPAGESYYIVTAVDIHGNESLSSNEVMIQGLSAVGGSQLPTVAVINGAWPNPFNPMTSIKFAVPHDDLVRLAIYDLRGTHVRTLIDGPLSAGYQSVDWNGRNDSGGRVASGVYFARLETGGQTDAMKMVLAK